MVKGVKEMLLMRFINCAAAGSRKGMAGGRVLRKYVSLKTGTKNYGERG